MAKLDNFDLDVKVKSTTKPGVTPSVITVFVCTQGCITGPLMGCNSKGCI